MLDAATDRSGRSVDAGSCVGKLHVDLERRNLRAAVDLYLHLLRVDADVAAHDRKNLLAQYRHEIGLADDPPLVFEQLRSGVARVRPGRSCAAVRN